MNCLIIDELSMVSSDFWTDINSKMGEIFMMIPEKAFAGLSVVTIADLLYLSPVRENSYFHYFFIRIVKTFIRLVVMAFI